MTETLTAPASAVAWRSAPSGLWIATTEGHPLGIVAQKRAHGFVATSRTGHPHGTHPTLEAAQAALEATLT